MRRGRRRSPEHDVQVAFIEGVDVLMGCDPRRSLVFAVPNGARTSFSVAKRLKAEGMRRGVADVLCLFRGFYKGREYPGLLIEFKAPKGGSLSPEQRVFLVEAEREGYLVALMRDAGKALELFEGYMKKRPATSSEVQ